MSFCFLQLVMNCEAGASPTSAGYTEDAAEAPKEVPAGCYSLEQLTEKRTWEKLDVISTERSLVKEMP